MSFINLRSSSYGRQASLNSVEHYIIQKLSGVNLNAAESTSSVLKEDATVYGSFPWQYRSAAELNRPTDQVLLEGELRDALIRLNPEIMANLLFSQHRNTSFRISSKSDGKVI
jgi:hypothetical protein